MATAKIIDPNTKEEIQYYIDDRMKRNLDEKVIPSLQQSKDKDCILALDGREGSGKSWFAFQIAKYVDPSFNLSRVVFSPDEFRDAIFKAKKRQAIVFDEAFTGFSSRSSLSGINRVLVSLMMQMRQKNLFVIIVLPTYFLLDKYVALFRTRALIHVYENKGVRGYFRLYNSKLKLLLYLAGQKTYSYSHKFVKTHFRGRFYGKFALGDEKVEALYRKKKGKALEDTEKSPMTAGQVKFREQRDLLIFLLRKNMNITYQKMSNYLDEFQLGLSKSQIALVCGKFGDDGKEKVIKDQLLEESVEEKEDGEQPNDSDIDSSEIEAEDL